MTSGQIKLELVSKIKLLLIKFLFYERAAIATSGCVRQINSTLIKNLLCCFMRLGECALVLCEKKRADHIYNSKKVPLY